MVLTNGNTFSGVTINKIICINYSSGYRIGKLMA